MPETSPSPLADDLRASGYTAQGALRWNNAETPGTPFLEQLFLNNKTGQNEWHKVPTHPDDFPTPILTAIEPSSCKIGDPDFTLVLTGLDFNALSTIHFAGHDEPTTFDPVAKTLSTGVKPSLWKAPALVECSVRNGDVSSIALPFTFMNGATQ